MLITVQSYSQTTALDSTVVPIDTSVLNLNHISDSTLLSDSTLIKEDTTISKDAIKSKVVYVAEDSMRFDMSEQKVYLYNKAQVNYEQIQLNAGYIEVDLAKNIVTANGIADSSGKLVQLPKFKEGAQEFQMGKITYNFKTKKGKISEVTTQEGEGFIKGNEVKKTAEDVMFIRNGYYTTCNLEHPHFSLSTTKLKRTSNRIVTGPTVLKIEDVPTPLALPFGFFPNTKGRASGILVPTYGDSRTRGFFLRDGGFYLGISDNLDVSVTGDIYTLGSWSTNFNTRYKSRYQYNGNLNFSYSNIIDGYEGFPNFVESKEFFVRWTHNQDPKARPGSRFSANVNVGTSTNFTNNLNSFDQDYLRNTFQSSITYSNTFPSRPYNLTVSARHDQNTQNNAFNLNIPEVSFNVSRQYPFKKLGKIGNEWWRSIYKNFGLSYNSTASSQLRTLDTLVSLNRLDELRQEFKTGVRHSVPVNTSFKLLKYLNVNPSINTSQIINFKTIRKSLDTNGIEKTDTIVGIRTGETFSFNTALTTKIYGLVQFKKGPIKGIRHVLTPSFSYNLQPQIKTGLDSYTNADGKEVEYSIFSNVGVYGSPNRERSERLGINLLNNLEMKVRSRKDTSGFKKITIFENLGFSTSYNTTADSLNWNPIAVNGRTRITEILTLQFTGTLDPYGFDSLGTRNVKINDSWNSQTGKFVRLTQGNLAFNFRFKGGKKKKKNELDEEFNANAANEQEIAFIKNNPDQFVDFNIPWSLSFTYNLRYSKPFEEEEITQTTNFTGDLSLTQNWKIGVSSGWDFEQNDLTFTRLSINRDLHCWQLAVDWIPFGPRQSYNITLNVKSAVLQDLKLNRRREFFDVIQ